MATEPSTRNSAPTKSLSGAAAASGPRALAMPASVVAGLADRDPANALAPCDVNETGESGAPNVCGAGSPPAKRRSTFVMLTKRLCAS